MNLKRIGLIITILSAAIVLTACNNQAGNSASNSKETNTIKKETNTNKTENNMASTTIKKTIDLTRDDFLKKVANIESNPEEWVYIGDKPAIIDFYADWCGPCKTIAPILEELAHEYEGEIVIYKVDTEAEQQLAAEFGIRSIPSILFVPMNEAPQMAQGALPKDAFKQAIDEVLLKKS